MEMNYLFNTNAVLLNDESPKEALTSHSFNFLKQNIFWEMKNQGVDVILKTEVENDNGYGKIFEKVSKFASLIVYRFSHINKFEYVTSSNANLGQLRSEAGVETRFFMRGNEDSFDSKMWSMLSFFLEARNSTSKFYEFICLYKIIEIYNLRPKIKNGKKILEEDKNATKSFINNEIVKVLTDDDLDVFQRKVAHSKLRDKSIGAYFNHLLRDAFSHTGFIVNNDYKYGYPTLNPLLSKDIKKYNKAVSIFRQLAGLVLRKNESNFTKNPKNS